MEGDSVSDSDEYLQPEELCTVLFEDDCATKTAVNEDDSICKRIEKEKSVEKEKFLEPKEKIFCGVNLDIIDEDFFQEGALAMNFVSTILKEELITCDENITEYEIDHEVVSESDILLSENCVSPNELNRCNYKKDNKNRFVCESCNKRYKYLRNLNIHIRTHTGLMELTGKKYICEFCHKIFNRSSNLNKHVRIHTSERPFNCEECLKTFVTSYHLKRHSRIHTGVRPYSCNICQKSFITNSHLNRHSYVHTGEKPYSCKNCDKSFTTFSHLVRHYSRVHSVIS